MALRLPWLGLIGAVALQLAACNGSDPPPLLANTIQAIPSTQTAAGVVGGNSQTISITFISSDSEPISDLSVSGLASLASGWSAPATFSCSSVTTGSGCVLNLSYAPAAVGSGTLSLTYSFTNALGASMSDTVSIPYTATSNDNVVATAAPTGQVNAVVGDGFQAVTLTFTTDDGQAATGLTLTSSLSALPAGWSSTTNSFSCTTISTGNGCQLALTFAPQAAGSGTLSLEYRYTDNAGEAKSGSASIAYASTTNDNVAATVSPTGEVTATAGGSGASVLITFATDDGNPATALDITAGLSSLPTGWSGPGTFSCSTISAGTACQLSLSYAPQYTGSGTLTLGYSYNNDAGNAETATLNVSYLATGPHLYVTNLATQLDACSFGAGGTLSSCAATPASGGPVQPVGIAFDGNTAYIADWGNRAIDVCAVAADGSLSDCSAYSDFPSNWSPWALTVVTAGNGNTYLYATDPNTIYGSVQQCTLAANGGISSCTQTASGIVYGTGLAMDAGYAYIGTFNGSSFIVDACTYNNDGSISGCVPTGSGFNNPSFITVNNGYVYVIDEGNGKVSVCTVGTDGALSSCPTSALPGSTHDPNSVVFYDGDAYVDDDYGNLWLCAVDSGTGALSDCAQDNGGNSFYLSQQLAIH